MKCTKNILYLIFAVPTIILHLTCCYLALSFVKRTPLAKNSKKAAAKFVKKFSHHSILSILGFWFPNKIFVKYPKKAIETHKNIVISNHVSDFDWIFVSQTLYHIDQFSSLFILMKKSLKDLPIIGYCLEEFGHLFLNRNRDKDSKIIKKYMKRFNKEQEYNILIFPEGTYPYSESLQSAQIFAKKTELKVKNRNYCPERVLLPRKLGFSMINKGLKDSYDGIIDMTLLMNPYMKMPYEECTLYELLIKGSKIINQAVIISFIPQNQIKPNYLNETFSDKDELLETYERQYNGCFNNLEEFSMFLENTNMTDKDDIIDEIEIKSKYKYLFFVFSPYTVILIFLLIKFFINKK